MIFVRDKGRMCNNMLQYGHAYAWAREHGRKVMSLRFSYKYQYFRLCHERKHNFLSYITGKYAAQLGLIPKVSFLHPKDEGSSALEEQMLSTRHFMLEGWYVRYYDLFLKYKQEILEMFQFESGIVDKIQAYLHKAPLGTLRLGVHIRRGDYATFMGGKFFYEDSTYIAFIKQFVALHADKHVTVYICTNDPQLNQVAYTDALPECEVVFPHGNQAEDLYLLSECDFLMGAPSTYSLVAAMYHDTPLLWMLTADAASVCREKTWGRFNDLFRHII